MPVAMPEEEEEEEPDYIPKASKRRSRDVNDDYEVEGREDAAAREAETNDLREARPGELHFSTHTRGGGARAVATLAAPRLRDRGAPHGIQCAKTGRRG